MLSVANEVMFLQCISSLAYGQVNRKSPLLRAYVNLRTQKHTIILPTHEIREVELLMEEIVVVCGNDFIVKH